MKETDIVQALRCCAEGECKDCAMHEDKQRCQENLLDKAAEVIERLTAENAALRETKFGAEPVPINRQPQSWRYMVPCDSREVTVIRAIQPNSLPEVVRYIEDIGKTVFLSREEAEKALQEMEGKKDGNETNM